jgi:trimethylamine corrinoid protein
MTANLYRVDLPGPRFRKGFWRRFGERGGVVDSADLTAAIVAYNEAILDTDRDRALQVVKDLRARQTSPEDIVFKVIVPAMEILMDSIGGNPDANLAQHFLAASIGAEVTEAVLKDINVPIEPRARVIIGTAPGDFHSLGKRIVCGCLRSLLYDVVDLGNSVPAERFVDEAVARDARVIAVSAMMMHTARGEAGSLGVRRLLRERGLEDRIKLVVGGAPFRFDPQLYKTVGADGWAPDGIAAGKLISAMVQEDAR